MSFINEAVVYNIYPLGYCGAPKENDHIQAYRLDKVLDSTGYRYKDKGTGVLALKEMLILAKRLGITTQGMDENGIFGDGTQIAVNQVLKKGGYEQNGIAGDNFIKYLAELIKSKT